MFKILRNDRNLFLLKETLLLLLPIWYALFHFSPTSRTRRRRFSFLTTYGALVIKLTCWRAYKSLHTRLVHERIFGISVAQPGPNGQLSCLHSFKIFWPMKPSYKYRTGVNISRSLYIFYHISNDHFFVFKKIFSKNSVLMHGLCPRAAYDSARTVP